MIFEASQHRLKEIDIPLKNQRKFQCQGPKNMLIDIVINNENIIKSGYPSIDNFQGL